MWVYTYQSENYLYIYRSSDYESQRRSGKIDGVLFMD